MTDRIRSNRQERPDGIMLYRPVRSGPTYVLTKEHDAKIRRLLLWQVVLGFVAGMPTLAALLSWLSGDLSLPAVLASTGATGAILAVATPMGLHLERRRKDIVRQAPVSETQIELPGVRHQLARLWSIMPPRHRFALRAAPILMLLSSAVIVLKHLFGGFPDQAPPLSLTLSTVFFVLCIPLCWLVVRTRSDRTPFEKG